MSPSEPTKAEEHIQRGSDGFEIIGGAGPGPLYPSAQLPAPPVPPAVTPGHGSFNRQYSVQIANYTQNVPFKLNPVLNSNSEPEQFEYRLREINQMMSQISNSKDYDFKLERSIVEQS